MFDLWRQLFGKIKEVELPQQPQPSPVEEKRAPRVLDRLLGRFIYTSHGGPNAPKFQLCEDCGKWVKRTEKTLHTAKYECRKCHSELIISLR